MCGESLRAQDATLRLLICIHFMHMTVGHYVNVNLKIMSSLIFHHIHSLLYLQSLKEYASACDSNGTGMPQCTSLPAIFLDCLYEVLYLQTSKIQLHTYGNMSAINNSIDAHEKSTCIHHDLLTTPVFINCTILPCPPGFYLSESHHCECYSVTLS